MKKESLKELFKIARESDSYWTSKTIMEFTSDLYQLMKQMGKTKAEVARSLKTSQAYMTKVFKGDVNFTIDSMVKLSRTLGGKVHIHVVADNINVRWIDVITTEKKPDISWKTANIVEIKSEVSKDVNAPIAA